MLQIKPIDFETGEILNITPKDVKSLDNEALAEFAIEIKRFDKLKKEAENELKTRLLSGGHFESVSLGKAQMTSVIVVDDKAKMALVNKYGWDSVEPLSLTQLKKKYGEGIEKDLEPYIVFKPKAQALKWD